MSKHIIYPTYQRSKNVGEQTRLAFFRLQRIPPETRYDVTTADLERLYHSTGQQTDGACEVRWAWKYNDLKPRVYYAQGGESYFASRYIREIANSFCDILPTSNRQSRYNSQRLGPLTDQTSVAVYDYSSFTSEMSELKYFLERLGEWCIGTEVKIVDTNRGVVVHDLGRLILEYNTSVNCGARMDITRIYNLDEPQTLEHNKSGMLGVYGNIVWSTALHGIFLTFVTGEFDLSNVVGDDAQALLNKMEWSALDFISTLRLIGNINEERTEFWMTGYHAEDSTGWQFLKRPFDRLGNHLYTGLLFDIPLAVYVCPEDDGVHSADLGSFRDRVKAFIMQTCRLLDRLHIYECHLSEEELDFALGYLTTCYRELRLPPEGSLPPFSHSQMKGALHLAIPILHRESIARPWLDVLARRIWPYLSRPCRDHSSRCVLPSLCMGSQAS
jgi:hypothetical protein